MVKLPQLDPMTAAQPPDQNLHLNACLHPSLDLFSTYLHLNIRFEDIFNQTYQNLTAEKKSKEAATKIQTGPTKCQKVNPSANPFVCLRSACFDIDVHSSPHLSNATF